MSDKKLAEKRDEAWAAKVAKQREECTPDKIYAHGVWDGCDERWNRERVNDTDVEYIRYDLYRKREKELTDQIKFLIAENNLTDKE